MAALVNEINQRPGYRQQLGETAYQGLLAAILDPHARINSIWAETLYPFVCEALKRDLPMFARELRLLSQRLTLARYTGPRRTAAEQRETTRCPRCGDTATITGPGSADCWSCGRITPPRTR